MGTRTIHMVFDDIDGTTDKLGTYRFAIDGIDYEIDLSADNLATLRAAPRSSCSSPPDVGCPR